MLASKKMFVYIMGTWEIFKYDNSAIFYRNLDSSVKKPLKLDPENPFLEIEIDFTSFHKEIQLMNVVFCEVVQCCCFTHMVVLCIEQNVRMTVYFFLTFNDFEFSRSHINFCMTLLRSILSYNDFTLFRLGVLKNFQSHY